MPARATAINGHHRMTCSKLPLLSTLLIALASISGCKMLETTNNPSDPATQANPSQPGSSPAPAPPPPIAGYGNIPDTAQRVLSGTGKLDYKVNEKGTVWVGNEDRRFAVLRQGVRRGDRIEVFPDRDRIELNDQPIYEQNLERGDRHAIFFRASSSGSGSWSDGPNPYGDIHHDAENMASGSGSIAWHAEAAGQIWVGDDKQKKSLFTQRVKQGDLIELAFNPDQIKINGKVVYTQNLESKHDHAIFFK